MTLSNAYTPQGTQGQGTMVADSAVQMTDFWGERAGPASGITPPGLWLGYLAALIVAELVVSLVSPFAGFGLHAALLFALPVHALVARPGDRRLLLALTLAPLVRIVSLGLPLAHLPVIYWYLLTSVPLFVGGIMAARTLGLSRRQLGLRWGRLPTQVAITMVGLPLGVAEYLILRPAPLISRLSLQQVWLPALILIACTGLLEEFLFRGVLQAPARACLGRWGIVFVSAVFAALHIGYLSVADVVFVFLVGMLFALLSLRSGSILGVTLAHGLTNMLLYLILPFVAVSLGLAVSRTAAPVGKASPPAVVDGATAGAAPLEPVAPGQAAAGVGLDARLADGIQGAIRATGRRVADAAGGVPASADEAVVRVQPVTVTDRTKMPGSAGIVAALRELKVRLASSAASLAPLLQSRGRTGAAGLQ